MESTVLHLRLDTGECETLDRLAGKALNRQAVARMILIAGIEAIQANRNMVHLPPRFTVDDGGISQGETQLSKPTIRDLPKTGKVGRGESLETRALMDTLPKSGPGGSK